MRPEVTAVITTHGRPEHVGEALRRSERHADRECLVVEDGHELDDVEAMHPVRERLHAAGVCLGSRMASHGVAGERRSAARHAEIA
jgi:hypothetical protein